MASNLKIETKICGLSDPASIAAAIDGGAAQIGFIFFEKSPRHISIERVGELAQLIGDQAKRVAVSVDADNNYLDQIVDALSPDVLQLHGRESPQRVQQVKDRYSLDVMKVFAIHEQEDFEQVNSYLSIADRLLFDAKPPKGAELPGGNGVSFDWKMFANWQKDAFNRQEPNSLSNQSKSKAFAMLSGGLNIENIVDALERSKAMAVDISSGVEKAPGIKDPALITAFLDAVRSFESRKEVL